MRIHVVLVLLGLLVGAGPAAAKNPVAGFNKPVTNRFKARRTTPAWLTDRTMPVAHRGLHGVGRPENSMLAFRAAVRRGVSIELDVHLLSDGKVAVFHDTTLNRMTGRTGKIRRLTSAEARKIKLKGSNETIPMLDDVLKMVNGRVPVLVELKGKGKVNGVKLGAAVNRELKARPGRYAVIGFNPLQLRWFRKYAPSVLRGQVSGGFKKIKAPWIAEAPLRNLALNFISRPHFIVYEAKALPKWSVDLARKARNKPVLGYTITSPEQAARAKPHVDNIIFEGYDPNTAAR